MSSGSESLNPSAKLLIQKYVVALVGGFGTARITMFGLIAAVVFSSIQANANATAKAPVEATAKDSLDVAEALTAYRDEVADLRPN